MKMMIILMAMVVLSCAQKIMYFHHAETDYPKQMDFSDLRNSPSYMILDCSNYDCSIYLETSYPSLYYWKGPGSAFERIEPPTYENARRHIENKEIGIVNQLRIHLQTISLFHMLLYSLVFGYGLFSIFSALFTPPNLRDKKGLKK